MKIYCAGPLFNDMEKMEMAAIAKELELAGLDVFLPHRDGFEFANLFDVFCYLGFSSKKANEILNKAIFTLDVFQVLDSDGLILNINGRVPDEGAMVEAGIAWNAGKKVVIYKNDSRTLINGYDNPLLLGLGGFEVVSSIPSIPEKFISYFSSVHTRPESAIDNSNVKMLFTVGKKIALLAGDNKDKEDICKGLIELLEG